ncbi:EI24 domain-containing protein [Pseudaestuariivita rosea]|uniref:EI24 domain-containing protein n=1 Tax=Pseudaestuariivita rosea TaxID=2763263 RepID=UPI001ABB11C0|nr:EI24 domain-containing protein [Pseudaestuariivita rosea]
MIFTSFFKAISQIGDPKFLRVLLMGFGLTIALLFGFYLVFLGIFQWIFPDSLTLPWIGEINWIDDAISWASIPLMLILSVFLMVPVASAITGLFLDQIAQAVEDRHYTGLPKANEQSFVDGVKDSIGFLGVIIGANILALILYIFLAPLALFIFWGMNGYLLGREYFQMVAIRRMSAAEAKALRKRHALTVWAAGALMTVPLTIPFINLIIPILGVATFTHLFHRVRALPSG